MQMLSAPEVLGISTADTTCLDHQKKGFGLEEIAQPCNGSPGKISII